ncbi:E3 ubiquitin-protein ligase RGLG2 [Cryptomeria japonica]|uniref:E3 ubiquitin-protein ligase RGLG2 n=1 Tax=Cryptomeria japonica TaxID=3369 RepID=UPI0027DA139C|nr:E3 ubiquitin-protein ligase RGLG2 [Cryptomeria japonica]XP_057840563.2 E3 ubiquitin-protein ligase RGLG2 [Cryptomeria japonica]XP_057840564.2 E3 ubiquitin-protein ligase RGLG2 [Cryptomeria japonica]XP_057840565.2 E3 ubiquitin-protein ligase RGLG2 [Cryptomeria japonica]XP_057840567.2 E3 ubiquitin-protein ligase RGLG2 [Cryptomeria japonica]XP_059076724.1 E3 ubiquitin-protein ligase RGLG2 [Cryptomeria japonica]
MGGKSSKIFRQRSQSWGARSYESPQTWNSSSYGQQSHPSDTRVESEANKHKLQRRYSRIADNYDSLDKVTEALAQAGLESSNLIVGIDFTKSNEWTGTKSFNRRSLHHLGDSPNPYEQAISIIGRTLSAFDEDNLIPCFGFGDASTHDQQVFSFYPDDMLCNGFEEALRRYREIVPQLRLAGPTSFAPIIEAAIRIVEQSGGQYHVLLIIADGQVTRSVDTENSNLSPQEQNTVNAIVQASEYPLSIVLVGVGDGPWDMMQKFDDNIPARSFDNFQFVNFTAIMSKNIPVSRKETEFALAALMEIPSQYKATLDLQILGRRRGKMPNSLSLPPPIGNANTSTTQRYARSESFQTSSPPDYGYNSYGGSAPPTAKDTWDAQMCPICLTNPKNLAFGCGHQTCADCGQNLDICPICRTEISTRIKLY